MTYDVIKISGVPEITTPSESTDIVLGDGNYLKRIKYNTVKADMVGISPSYTTDTEPYLMRQTANIGVVGKCALNKLVGGSLGWNQLTPTATISQTSSGITFSSSNNGTVSVSGTATARAVCNIGSTISGKLGHVFLIKGCPSGGSAGTYWLADGYDGGGTQKDIGSGIIIKKATDTYITQIVVASGTALSGTKTFVPQAFDLTAMFGSTIADYVYGLEQATAGAGVAWLSQYIDLSTYHAYDAGSIQSVQATAHVTTGFNVWNEVWELGSIAPATGQDVPSTAKVRSKNYIPVLANTEYHIHVGTTTQDTDYLYFYDGNKNFISSSSYWHSTSADSNFTTPTNARYMRFIVKNTAYNNDICINISRTTGTPKNGDYVPYNGHSYPLGADTLRGIPQLVDSKLAYDGDIKTPDGTTRRRYGTVDLGTLTYSYNATYGMNAALPSDAAAPVISGRAGVCGRYTLFQGTSTNFADLDKVFTFCNNNMSSQKRIFIKDSAYTDAATFKTAMSGVYFVYPLETETTESSTSYQKIQTIDADGTESFTTSSPVPVGHETQTPDNILAALEWLGE